jgi:peptide-methionine (S)-S-oxide reductase
VEYDPRVLSYDDLLGLYWECHSPTHPAFSRQYRSAIMYHSEAQRQAADASLERMQHTLGRTLYVDIEPAREFWTAEDYHQKYYLRGEKRLMAEFAAMYPHEDAFVDSTAAARCNGYVAGAGDPRETIDRLGLTEEGRELLLGKAGKRRFTCA